MDITNEIQAVFPNVQLVRAIASVTPGTTKTEAVEALIEWLKADNGFGQ